MRLDAAKIEAHADRRLVELREVLRSHVGAAGSLSLADASAYMRAVYAKGYTDGLSDDQPPPFAVEAERLLRSRASLAGSRARR